MRVTFVLPDANNGGGTRGIVQHAEMLRRRGHSLFIVLTPPWDYPLKQKFGIVLRGGKWPKARKRFASHLDSLDIEHRVLRRRRPVTDRDVPDADVVIATWWETAGGVYDLSPSKGAKAYFIQQYEVSFGQPAEAVDATWRLPMQKICCSRWLAELARDKFGDPTAVVARNGLDPELFDAPERGRQTRPTVGMQHSPSPEKGWAVGREAFLLAKTSFPDLRLVVFGGRPMDLSELPPDAEFIQDPPQSRIRQIYSECDVWLCSSFSEGYHLPPYEAMGCRCPVVSTRVGGPMDMIENGKNGFLVDPGDAPALADRIVRVLQLPGAGWKALSDAAYATSRGFTIQDGGDEFERALFKAVAGGSSNTLPATEKS